MKNARQSVAHTASKYPVGVIEQPYVMHRAGNTGLIRLIPFRRECDREDGTSEKFWSAAQPTKDSSCLILFLESSQNPTNRKDQEAKGIHPLAPPRNRKWPQVEKVKDRNEIKGLIACHKNIGNMPGGPSLSSCHINVSYLKDTDSLSVDG